ncbi:MAG: cation-translocating P-type ATPase [Bacillota bacterium]|nr:cation-translocating P-type ATPase [Bacillota bacterium]
MKKTIFMEGVKVLSEKRWYNLTPEEALKDLGSDREKGLTTGEAKKRLEKWGKNLIENKKRDRIILVFFRQFCDFMVMVLMGAAVISAACGEIVDAMMILAIILLNGILGFVQEYKAERSLESLKKLYTDESLVLRNGVKVTIPADDIVPGDIVVISQGDKAPADMRLLEAWNIEAEEAILTGEAHFVSKSVETIEGRVGISECKNMLFSGTTIVKGRGLALVTATAMNTEMGKIADLLSKAGNDPTPLQLRLKSLGKWLIAICVGICVIISLWGMVMGGDIFDMVLTGVSLGVASIPEGLPAIVTICLALGVWRLAKCNAIVKKLPAVETLGSTTVICTDKTGTLTENRMALAELFLDGAWLKPEPMTYKSSSSLGRSLKVMATCHSLHYADGEVEGDPTEVALFKGVKAIDPDLTMTTKPDREIPFDSRRRMMSTLVQDVSYVKGAPGAVMQCCHKILVDGGEKVLTGEIREQIRRQVEDRSSKGYRVLALAYRKGVTGAEAMERDLVFLSLAALTDPIRADVFPAMAKAEAAGIKTVMITGDHNGTALAVAKALSMASEPSEVALGKDVQTIKGNSGSELDKKRVFARVSPEDKMKIVRFYKDRGEVVAMTGDGVNDAPALKEADIGIAMGLGGADVTREAADFILADNNFASIVQAVEEGRGIYDNIRKFIRYLLSSNLGEVLTMFIAVAFGFPLPLVPLQILWINLATDGLPALALGLERPAPSLMQKKPRPKNEGIFAGGLGKKIFLRGILIGLTSIGVFLGSIIAWGEIDIARTMAFTALVFSQLFYVFDCRSEDESPFALGFFSNPYLTAAVVFSAGLQCLVLYVPWFQQVFHTVPLTLSQWGIILVLTAFPTIFSGIFHFFPPKAYRII